jgi:peptide/nickel transport system substrate-binding protein
MPAKNSGESPPQSGGTAMNFAMFSRTLLRAALALGLIAILAGTAAAQKRGGSITVGLELDIPGLDPLKIGVYDTAAEMAAARCSTR